MELQTFTSFQFCILLVWSANGDAPFQVNLLNDDTYLWNCATSSYGQIRVRCALNMDIYMDTTTDHFTPLALRVRGKNGSHYRASEFFSFSLKIFVFLKLQSQSKLNPNQIQIKSIPSFLLFFLPLSPGPTGAAWLLPSSPVLLFFLRLSPWPTWAVW